MAVSTSIRPSPASQSAAWTRLEVTENAVPEASEETQELRAEIVRLNKMVTALMNRAERDMSAKGSEFGLFQTAVTLENQVRERTSELEAALRENEKINRALQTAKAEME